MHAIRSTSRVAAIAAAAAAGACLMLAGCGGGSTGGTAAGSSSSGGSAAPSATASFGSSAAGFPAPKLTGHFCTDFTNLGHNLPKVPVADRNSLAALHAHGGQFLQAAAAYFNGLAGEAPPQASAELKTIASAYSALASGASSASSIAQLEQQMAALTTKGKPSQAFIGLITYISTHCG
jgi:hypothetical protein